MGSKSDGTDGNHPILAVRLQIINYDPINCSSDVVAASSTVFAVPETPDERSDDIGQNQKKLPLHYRYRKTKRKRRGFKHDENATVYISHEDLDFINSSSSSFDDDNSDAVLSDGVTCRLFSKTNDSVGSKILQELSSVLVADTVAYNDRLNHQDRLWVPVILRVLPRESLLSSPNRSSGNSDVCNNSSCEEEKEESAVRKLPTIFIPPCIGATIGIHWFCRNNMLVMTAYYIQPLPQSCIVEGISATVKEIGSLSPLMMNDAFANYIDNIRSSDNDEEERQLRQFFLSKRQNTNSQEEKHLHPSCRRTNHNSPWKPRQRLLTVGSIFATPVISTYCDCYDRMCHFGTCKESIDNVRLYQVVDIQSSSESGDGDDDDDVVMVEDEGSRRKIAYIVSPMTHLTLQSKQQNDKGTNGFGLTWRLPRPSFALTYLQSSNDNNDNSCMKEKLKFGCVSNVMSKSKPNAIYHPSAKSLSDAIYLQGVVVNGITTSEAFLPPYNGPRIVHVIGESENNVRGCIDEASDMMGMRSLHVCGLVAFLAHYDSIYNHDKTRTILTGGLSDKLKGLAAAIRVAKQCSPCLLHVEGIDHELTPSTGQMADASGRDEEERRILQVIRENTLSSSRRFISSTHSNDIGVGHDVFLSSCTTPKVIVVFSTSDSLPPGPISSSLQQASINIDPPDRKYAQALWDDDVDGTFEPLSTSLMGLSARDISYLRQLFAHDWDIYHGRQEPVSDDGSGESNDMTPFSVLEPLLKDLEAIRSFTQPSRKVGTGGSSTLPLSAASLPNVRWEDVGGMENIRKEIMDAVELPLKYPHFFEGSRRSGILLFGPPGTGKTMLAKAIASECGLPFISIKGPELLGSYVGESEANIRAVFEAARSAALHSGGSGGGGYNGASVLFFDELDSLAPRRGETGFGDGVMDRVVSTLLGELDGREMKSSTKGSAEAHVIVIGATNRPDLLDPSLLRPGRFDRLLYLGPAQTKETMLQILKAQTRKFKFEPGSDSDTILRKAMEAFPPTLSGADLSAVASKALMRGLKRVCDKVEKEAESLNLTMDPTEMKIGVDDVMETWSKVQLEPVMCVEDFIEAAKSVVPSISQKDLENFEKLQQQFASR